MIVVNARFLTQNVTGVQRFAIEISLELKKHLDSAVLFVAPHNILHHDYAQRLGAVTIGKHKGYLWEQTDLPIYLKKQGSPLLLCLCNTAPILYGNKIVTLHDVAFYIYPKMFSKSFLAVYRFLIPSLLKSSIHIITVSHFSKKEIVRYCDVNLDKISVVYNAVSGGFCYVEDLNLQAEKYFLAVSSLNFRKNFPTVLEAFQKFETLRSEGKLFIIGDLSNSSFSTLDIDRYKLDPRIKFLGRVTDDELVRYYSNAIAFIYPSLYEGFGIPPLEAQQCHCPVISSDTTSLPEVLRHSALLNSPTNIDDFVSDMQKLYTDENLREELISRGLENLKRFSWEQSAKKVCDIIKLINHDT